MSRCWRATAAAFADARRRLNECPLGAGALAGTSFPIDREMTAKALGFDRPTANSLDSVADRDFALETLAAVAISAMHLSRFAEELVIWSSAEFRFIKLSDKFTSGSSMMPQKRNPDAAELVRAKVGRIAGAFQGLLMVMKGLPLTYSKDMQEDKEMTFDALDTYALVVAATAGMVADLAPQRETMRAAAMKGYSTATDLADWIVQHLGIPFRDAHHITGRAVAEAESRGVRLDELPLEALQAIEPRITKGVFDVLTVENSVASRISIGGTAPQLVRKSAEIWLRRLSKRHSLGLRGLLEAWPVRPRWIVRLSSGTDMRTAAKIAVAMVLVALGACRLRRARPAGAATGAAAEPAADPATGKKPHKPFILDGLL